jgi:hypothetical protein
MLLSDIKSQGVSMQILNIGGKSVRVQYHTLENYRPKSNQNYVAIFKSNSVNAIPWDDKPLAVADITLNDMHNGSIELVKLGLTKSTPYIIGYSLSPYNSDKPENNFCSSMYIGNVDDRAGDKSAVISLSISELDSHGEYIKIQYSLLKGYNPKKNNNWIGVWEDQADYLEGSPLASVKIEEEASKEAVSLYFDIVDGCSYNVYYFCGGGSDNIANSDRKCAAAVLSFSANDEPRE